MLFKKRDEWARPLAEYDVIAALPDSVVAKPLGLLEEREPRVARAAPPAGASRRLAGDLPGAVKAALPAKLAPQLATLADAACRRAATGSRDQVRRLPAAGAHRQRQVAALSRAAATTGPTRCRRSPRRVEALGRALGLARRRDRRARATTARPNFNALQNAFDSVAHRAASSTSCSTCRTSKATTCARCRCATRRALLQARSSRRRASERACASAPTSTRDPASMLEVGARAEARRHHRQARRRALRVAAHRDLAQAEVPAAPGVRHRRLHRPQRARAPRSAACCSAITTRAAR